MHLLTDKETEEQLEVQHKFYVSIVHIETEEVVDDKTYQAINIQDGFNDISAWLDQKHPARIEDDEVRIEVSIYNL